MRDSQIEEYASKLTLAPKFRFSEWPNTSIPRIAPGVYAVYDENDKFLYVGMAGANLDNSRIEELSKIPGRQSGLFDRLSFHASGSRSGDRFNIYICDLFVLKNLTETQIDAISNQTLSLDPIIKEFIRTKLCYRYLVTENTVVRELEDYIQRNGLRGELPSINGKNSQEGTL